MMLNIVATMPGCNPYHCCVGSPIKWEVAYSGPSSSTAAATAAASMKNIGFTKAESEVCTADYQCLLLQAQVMCPERGLVDC
jgi:hypothetical protein